MALRENGDIILSERRAERRAGEGWLEILRRWLVECPQCTEIWLVVGMRENDRHVCKDCGHSFALRFSIAPSDGVSIRVAAARESQ